MPAKIYYDSDREYHKKKQVTIIKIIKSVY